MSNLPSKKWLVTGSSGLLGHNLCTYLASRGIDVTGLHYTHPNGVAQVSSRKANLIDIASVEAIVLEESPDVIVHAAGLTNVEACETNESLAKILHADIPKKMAHLAIQCDARMVLISTDHLWDGSTALISEEIFPQCG